MKIDQEEVEIVPGSGAVEVGASAVQMNEVAAVPGPAIVATEGRIWVKSTTPNTLFFTDDAGGDHDLTAGGGGGGTELDANATSENLKCARVNQPPTFDAADPGQVNLGSESVASHGTNGLYAAILSGLNNISKGDYSVVVGGLDNDIGTGASTDADYAFIGGGRTNVNQGNDSVVCGGRTNSVLTAANGAYATYNSIVGGQSNYISQTSTAIVAWNFIGGGNGNYITNTATPGSSPWTPLYYNSIVGGRQNSISLSGSTSTTEGYYHVICGGYLNSIVSATGNDCLGNFIGSGYSNAISGNSDGYSSIVGGYDNTISTAGEYGNIGGGYQNSITGSASYAAIGGGAINTVSASSATIAGGSTNNVSGSGGFIGGGSLNTISNASAGSCVIVGGESNEISNALGDQSNIGGGYDNTISAAAPYQTISGGYTNTISGSGEGGSIGGGHSNTVSAVDGTVPGGLSCTAAGAYGFATGRRAKADSSGSMALGDDRDQDVLATTTNELVVGMENGIRLCDTTEEHGNVWRVDENQTTTATPANAYTLTMIDNSAVSITARVTAMETDGSDRAFWIVNALVYRDGGGATIEGTVDAQLSRLSAGATAGLWAATIVVSSNDVSVQITGEAATTINWRTTCQFQTVG